MVVDNDVSNLEYYCFSNEEEQVPKGNQTNFIIYNRAVRHALDAAGGKVKDIKLVGNDF